MQIERPPSVRAFVGVALSERARQALAATQAELAERAAQAGWKIRIVPAASLHLTLKFLGSIEADRVSEFLAAMEEALSGPSFEIAFGGFGAFPLSPKRPTVLWTGVVEGAARLIELAEQTDRCYERFGFGRESRPFEPHLTLARVKYAPGPAAEVLGGLGAMYAARLSGVRVRASEVILFRSEPTSKYRSLGQVALGSP